MSNDGRFKEQVSMEKFTTTGFSLDKEDKSKTVLLSDTQQNINSLNGDLNAGCDNLATNMGNRTIVDPRFETNLQRGSLAESASAATNNLNSISRNQYKLTKNNNQQNPTTNINSTNSISNTLVG